MISKLKVFLLCPVPEDQKPIIEYIGLKENPLTSWTTLPGVNYKQKINKKFIQITLLFMFLSIQNNKNTFDWLITNLIVTTTLSICLFLIIIWRWNEIKKRLNQSRLFYEEASWYDGQIWEKPSIILKNDRLLASQKIQPILNRLLKTIRVFIWVDLILCAINLIKVDFF
jgi:hypothetical protein